VKVRIIDRPHYQVVEPLKRFNQKYTVLSRTTWDPLFQRLKKEYQKTRSMRIRKENLVEDYALRDASSYVADTLGTFAGFMHGNDGLYSWKSLEAPDESLDSRVRTRKAEGFDSAAMSTRIKEVAGFFGADLVGIAKLNRFWLYSQSYNRVTDQSGPIKMPKGCESVIVMTVEMDYRTHVGSDMGASTATGLGYSKMAFVSSLTAQFIRNLGYAALPCGNDTALSIPLAVDAGLGELGRNGLLITPQFGPRVRLCKVITDLPLQPDRPIDFGVQEYCERCGKCSENCPAHAISNEKTASVINASGSSGVLKWPVNGEECFRFWCKEGIDCSICVRVCPLNARRRC